MKVILAGFIMFSSKKKSYQRKHANKKILLKFGETEKKEIFFSEKQQEREFRKKSIIYNNDF